MNFRADEITVGIGSLAVVGANLLAQVVPAAVPDVPAIPGMNWNSLTAQGMLAWYAWYVTTRAIPKIVSDGQAERNLEREERRKDREALLAVLQRCASRDEGPQA